MKIAVHWEIHPDKREDVFAAFAGMELSDYQGMGGPNVETIGRWHDVINGRGFSVLETTDPDAISEWLLKWNAAVDFEIAIVHDDAEAHAMVRKHVTDQG